MAMVLGLGAVLVAASTFHEPVFGQPSPSIAAPPATGSSAPALATAGPTATPEPTASPSQAPALGTPDVSASAGAGSCLPGFDATCPVIPAPTAAPSADPSTNRAVILHVPILEYHRVKPLSGESGYAVDLVVPPDTFAAQMDALRAAGWQTITMGQLGDYLRLGTQPSPRSFVISFDDGYEDGYSYAFPILQREGFVATFFVIAGRIGQADFLTSSEMRDLVAAGNEIGNHSISHVDLRVMTPERLVKETYGASTIIAGDVGVWPQSFSYPIGLTNPAVSDAVAATPGILTAVIQGGSKTETWANRLNLPRLRVGPGTYPPDLVERLNWYLP